MASFLLYGPITKDATPTHLFTIGTEATGKAHPGSYFAVASAPNGNIWAAETDKVEVYDNNGQFLFLAGAGELRAPRGIAFDTNGEVFITDRTKACVAACQLDGTVVRKMFYCEDYLQSSAFPWGIVADGKGLLFVAEFALNFVQVMKRDGTLLRKIKKWPACPESSPRQMSIHTDGRVFVVSNSIEVLWSCVSHLFCACCCFRSLCRNGGRFRCLTLMEEILHTTSTTSTIQQSTCPLRVESQSTGRVTSWCATRTKSRFLIATARSSPRSAREAPIRETFTGHHLSTLTVRAESWWQNGMVAECKCLVFDV